jgi:hypothetical protein
MQYCWIVSPCPECRFLLEADGTSEAEGCIGGIGGRGIHWRQIRQTELIGGRQTTQNLLEVGRVVRVLECIASRWSIGSGRMHRRHMEVDRAGCAHMLEVELYVRSGTSGWNTSELQGIHQNQQERKEVSEVELCIGRRWRHWRQIEQMEVSEVNRVSGWTKMSEMDKVDGSHQNYSISIYGVYRT